MSQTICCDTEIVPKILVSQDKQANRKLGNNIMKKQIVNADIRKLVNNIMKK